MGVFDNHKVGLYTLYGVSISLRDKLMAGVPKDPKIIAGWLRTKTSITDEHELQEMMIRTLTELGYDTTNKSYEELVEASNKLAQNQGTGFKRDERGLYLESRLVKAMLRESVNVLFAGERWGATKKGPKSYAAERVFINPDRLYFGKNEPDGVELFVGHVSGPQGPRSTLTYYEYMERPTIDLEIMVVDDSIEHENWPRIWLHAQENGLGALRSQGFGRFDVDRWEKLTPDGARLNGRQKKEAVAV